MCLKYAELEKKLGEIDRARAIYVHASQYCDPSMDTEFWQLWHSFEVRHGNEDTFREMLRVKRSVQATYNTQINLMSAQMLAASKKDEDEEHRKRLLEAGAGDEMAALERQAMEEERANERKPMIAAPGATVTFTPATVEAAPDNTEEIALELGEEAEGEGEGEGEEADKTAEIVQMQVPSAVFGSLRSETDTEKKKEDDEGKPLGALARLKRGGK
jgi:pre-mRNA-splicing factor SYF1